MAFLDLFKKQNETAVKETKALQRTVSDQTPEVEIFSGFKTNSFSMNESRSESVPVRHMVNWPKIGGTVDDLIVTQQINILVDASFIRSSAFLNFTKTWHTKRISKSVKQFYFIPTCEIKKLSEEERSRLVAGDYHEYAGDDISICLEKMFNQDSNRNIVLLTTNGDVGYSTQKVAQAKGLRLRWYGMDNNGRLYALYAKNQQQAANRKLNKQKASDVNRPFKLSTELVQIRKSNRTPNNVPTTGGRVITGRDGSVLYLKGALMTDHTSVTYTTSNEKFFAKVYTMDALRVDMLENKANRMLQEKIEIRGVCWPVDTLNDNMGCFVGVLVPASKGVQLSRSVFSGATGLAQFFPQWNKGDLCILTMNILDKICKMHDLGLMFGCINPASIYVAGAEVVYFVDTDCWQIEGYPALSHNQTFTPPEIIRENKTRFFYTMDQENYQIALLTFMLMMPGKFPYAKGKDANERDSIKDMAFPFSVGGGMRQSQAVERPSGIWRIVWDHLPYKMCDSFYNSFHSMGRYASPGKRLRDIEWLEMTKDYGRFLATSERNDSCSMFPRTFRRDGKRAFVRCSKCGHEHPDFYFMHSVRVQKEKINIWERGYRICLPCADDQSEASFECECCGRRFYYTNRTKLIHEIGKSDFEWERQKWCRNCKKRTVKCGHCGREVPIYQIREFEDKMRHTRTNVCSDCFKDMIEKAKHEKEVWKNSVDHWASCRSCSNSFPITNGDIEHIRKKGWNLPTRCPNCRGKGN